jgi:alkylhydroperoxidase/carboxymuconolactone decarboxylase family protein YurZ
VNVTESPYADLLRRLALNDVRTVDALLRGTIDADTATLGEKTCALLSIAALIATESAAASYQWAVANARAAGADEAEIVGVLITVAATVGVARITSAAGTLGAALGYDLDVLGEA